MNEQTNGQADFGQQLKDATVCVEFRKTRCGMSRAFTAEQNRRTAEEFKAAERRVSGRRKVIDSKHSAIQKVLSVQNAADAYWKSRTAALPGVNGRRLLNKAAVESFEERMTEFDAAEESAKAELRLVEHDIAEQSRADLAELWQEGLLPPSIADEFSIGYSYVQQDPPESMLKLHPEIYEREQKRLRALYDAAAAEASRQLTEELHKLVANMVERLSTAPGEKPKTFKNTLVGNVSEFFNRFNLLNVGNDEQLEAAVEAAKATLTADGEQLTAEKIRKDVSLRKAVASDMAKLQETLATMVVEKPKRRVRFDKESE